MNTVTIPKNITKGEELIVISRKKYEQFLRLFGNGGAAARKLPAALEEGLRDLEMGRVTPAFSSVREFKRFLKKK